MKLARLARITVASIVMAVGTLTLASPASAGIAPNNCTYIKQLGDTSYITWKDGTTAASVKQMYGTCNGVPKNWTYVWVWESFRTTHYNFWVEGEIASHYPYEEHGHNTGGYNQREFTSWPVSTTTLCTHAQATLWHLGESKWAATEVVC